MGQSISSSSSVCQSPQLVRNSKSHSHKLKYTDITRALYGKSLVLCYFGFSSCPPCVALHKKLVPVYESLQKQSNNPTEIIYVSADDSQSEFETYFAKHPWFAIPYEDQSERVRLQKQYGVDSFPQLILLNLETGKVEYKLQSLWRKDEKKFFDAIGLN